MCAMSRPLGTAALLVFTAAGDRAFAQSGPRAEYGVAGAVVSTDEAPIANAEIRIEGKGKVTLRITQSDSTGHFSAERLSDAPVMLRVRAFGYAPGAMAVTTSVTTHHASVTVRLEATAARLAGVGITETAPDSDKKLADYRERRGSNSFAHFVDGDDIERRKPQFVSEMLRTVGGVTLEVGKLGNVLHIRGCSPLVWVDGIRMPGVNSTRWRRPKMSRGSRSTTRSPGFPRAISIAPQPVGRFWSGFGRRSARREPPHLRVPPSAASNQSVLIISAKPEVTPRGKRELAFASDDCQHPDSSL